MPETVILNATVAWDDEIEDSMSPDYGFDLVRPTTRAVAKPAGGRPWSREVANTGHTFSLSWLNRSYKCVQRIRYFFEQYEDGFFTIVDWDGGGRHYVGRFTGDFKHTQLGNDRYNVQGLAFEELPAVPMIEYPSDWDNSSVRLGAYNDFGDMMLSINGVWGNVALGGGDGTYASSAIQNSGVSGAFATYEYRGYGFRLFLGKDNASGQVLVQVDGVGGTLIDLYAPQEMGVQMVYEQTKLSLDLHRVKVQVAGSKNAASNAAAVVWGYLQVMR